MKSVSWLRRAALAGRLLCLAVLFAGPAQAHDDLNILARQGLMAALQLDAGALYAMAKGEAEYDADVAVARAAKLKLVASYDFEALFPDGTSRDDMSGKTRAKAEIWTAPEKFEQGLSVMRSSIDKVSASAGSGAEKLSAAVVEMGKNCGGCHKAFRSRDEH